MAAVSAGGQVVEHHAGRADLAVLDLVRVERADPAARSGAATPPARRCWPRGGRRTRRTASPSAKVCWWATSCGLTAASTASPEVPPSAVDGALDDGPRASRERPGLRVDGQRGLVAEQVADHRGQHERQPRIGAGTVTTWSAAAEALLALRADHDRRRLVGPVDRHLLGDVVGGRADEPGRAHQDQRLGWTGRCASCPRWRRRRSTCSRARTA